MDVGTLADLLATPIKCTLPLAKLLKSKIELWNKVGQCLKHMGIDLSLREKATSSKNSKHPKSKLVPLRKVGHYSEREDANTTLLVELNACKNSYRNQDHMGTMGKTSP